jgi:hypothetical protein
LTDVERASAKRKGLISESSQEYQPSRCAENDIDKSQIVTLSEGPPRDSLLTTPTVHLRSDGEYTDTHDQKQAQNLVKVESVQMSCAETNQPLRPSFEDARIRIVAQMTAYPALYILLWIPGIVNRGVEASGGTSITLQYLQASTQLIGLVDTIIFAIQQRNWRTAHRA